MTDRQKNLETIRAACIKANPEIVELKFGCRFKFPRGSYGTLLCDKEWKRAKFLVALPQLPPHYDELRWDDMEDVEIIGRPIRLADVLLAMETAKGSHHVAVRNDGGILVREGNGITSNWSLQWRNPFPVWNLRADNLEEQSDECVAFLAGLLS